MDNDIIPASENEECCSCHMTNVVLHQFITKAIAPGYNDVTHQHCEVCRFTLAGVACKYPTNSVAKRVDILSTIALTTNMVLEEIRKVQQSSQISVELLDRIFDMAPERLEPAYRITWKNALANTGIIKTE